MKNLILSLRIRPMVATTSSPLDAILGGIIWNRYRDPKAAAEVEMIERLDGIPMASVAVFPNGYEVEQVTKARNLAATVLQNEGVLSRIDGVGMRDAHKHGPFSSDDKRAYHLKLLQNSRNLIIPKQGAANYDLHFHVRGDRTEITRLLNLAGCIGSWRDGHGDILALAIREVEGHDAFGIVDGNDLLRPVPVSFSRGEKKRRFHGRFSNPYHPSVARQHGYAFDEIFVPHNPETMVPY